MEDNEPPEALNEDDEEEAVQENAGGDDDDDPEMNYIQLLLELETENPRLTDQQAARIINDNWIQQLRNFALDYILRTGSVLGFRGRTIYLSVTYYNRSLANDRSYTSIIHIRISCVNPTLPYSISVGLYTILTLLAVVCLSLAANMEEPNVPRLSQYPLGNFNLNVTDIMIMESTVRDDLNWDLNCVTPFAFLQFFQSRFNRHISEDTRRRTNVIILSSAVVDVRLTNDQRPSVIAVAAILVAVNNNLNRQELEIEINALPLNGFLNIDNVWYCYNRLRVLNNF